MAAERRIKALKARVKSLTASFRLIQTFVGEYDAEEDAAEVPVRLENLNALWSDFNKVQGELETSDEAGFDEMLKQRVEFETSYYKVKGFLVAKSPNRHTLNASPQAATASSSAAQAHTTHIRLPDVKLPTFSGNLDTWLNFHDLYLSLVHSSQELSVIQKFYYLRSSLAGDALKLIQSIPITATNYLVAWNLLVKHFQNTSRLKQNYVDALFEGQSLKRESSTELHTLVETFEANVKILQKLGEQTDHWDILLIRMLSSRLDQKTRRDWEEHSSTKDAVKFADLTAFIQRRVTVLTTLGQKAADPTPLVPPKKTSQARPVASFGANQSNQSNPRKCVTCSNHHPLYQCETFSKMSVDEKEKEVRRHQLCRNCLRKGHLAKDCSSTSTCRKCRGRHHTQLCSNDYSSGGSMKSTNSQPAKSTLTVEQVTPSTSGVHNEPATCLSANRTSRNVILATAVVNLIDDAGIIHTARALLDSGSECNFISEAFSQQLKTSRSKIHVPIAGIGRSTTHSRCKFLSTVKSRVSDFRATIEFLVLPKLTIDLPSIACDSSSWKIPPEIQLADPTFHVTQRIDLILGAEIFFDLFKVSGRISLGESMPTLVNSVLGWVASGKTNNCQPITSAVVNVATLDEIHRFMEKFWTLEEDQAGPCYSVEEAACEQHFSRTVSRTPEGRYKVRLPLKEDVLADLGDNRRTALRRFHLLESRLGRDIQLGSQYREFLTEYLDLGHMRLVSDHEEPPKHQYHLPHHAVVREESTTTKVRVVFDASCKTASGPSLNDAMMVGPIVQEDLRSIVMRARTHPVMLVSDIKQMYRQVLVDDEDAPLQRIVWRPTTDDVISTYELVTVTYGTASAPFLATRVLRQLADDEQAEFPKAAEVLRKDFYVDDLFSGADSIGEAVDLRQHLEALLRKGGFELRKWATNSQEVLDDIAPENRAVTSSFDLDRDQCIKTLGLHWEPATDHLRYKLQLPESTSIESLTKRLALSRIARIFDPLGLVGPVVTTAKLFMQSLWTLRDETGKILCWDQELSPTLKDQWHSFYSQLPQLNDLRIDRFVLCNQPIHIELHFFSDASEAAYGACAYVRSVDALGNINVALLTAKSKVAPLKKRSIPRLELCGALLAAELYEKVKLSLQKPAETFFWVDSTTVLCWLNSNPSHWTTFVANRVSKIQLASQNCSWNHVAGQQNPADLISRGTTADTIINNDFWWHGPSWLQLTKPNWPTQVEDLPQSTEASIESRKTVAVSPAAVEQTFIDSLVARFSGYRSMLKVTAYCLRFLQHCRQRNASRRKSPIIDAEERKNAEVTLIRLIQQQNYKDEWNALAKSKPLPANSRLKWYYPFMSTENIIRIGGRLGKSSLSFDTKHQILLPSSHRFSKLLMKHLHEENKHAATQLLLSILRLRYWLTGARLLAKTVVKQCLDCFRARPKLVEQFMAELPTARITASRPFAVTGIDYWGPILIKPGQRKAPPKKAYVAVFVCFSTKAVHIELVGDLSTAKFIQALRRFVSYRGLCSDIYSDNGRNFVGAANCLRKLVSSSQHHKAIANECASHGIRWHFNPPKASHFGGLWEAAIHSAQKHLLRVLGDNKLAYDDMHTLLAQIECCLNSRPIVPLSDDSSDLEPLTPGHFLTGSALKAVPDTDYTSVPLNRLNQWQQVQKFYQQIWKRWHVEYLSTLQSRTRWCNPPVEIKLDQLVIIKDENTPPVRWPMARIVKLHPGTDGVIRVVTLKTKTGLCTRPVAKICLLPISTDDDNKPPSIPQLSESSTPTENHRSCDN